MIVLSGDVHEAIGSSDQRFTDQSETQLAIEYAHIAAEYGLKVTLFVTGRALEEAGSAAYTLCHLENAEIAGHGWDSLRPLWWHGLLSRLIGSPHGPAWLQQRMIQRTCITIQQWTGRPVRSWRNHAYRHDRHTPRLLAQAGIIAWSDEVQPQRHTPYHHPGGVVSLPINTLPDHEHLYHGMRTPQFVAAEGHNPSYTPDAWCERVCTQVEALVEAGGVATILAHPICMQVADAFATFERLCAFLSRYPSLFAQEAAERLCVS